MLWLGLENQAKDWTAQQSEASFTVYAETVSERLVLMETNSKCCGYSCFRISISQYENQQNVLGNWTSKAMLRPKFSDSKGDVSILRFCSLLSY